MDTLGAGSAPAQHTYSYAYNSDGDRVSATSDSVTTTYTYDAAHQLTQEAPSVGATIAYTYDLNNNRLSMTSTSGATIAKTSYTYDSATNKLTSKADPDGKITSYNYDTSGNLTSAVYDSTGLNQTTSYTYDKQSRLTGITKPDGTTLAFGYDANSQRTSVSVTPPGSTSASVVNDVYQLGRLAYQTDGAGNLLASFTYDSQGTPVSVQVGANPASAPRYYYVYNGHGDVTYLTDTSGVVVASYLYDAWGTLTSSSESFPGGANGWINPYRYDGRDGARYDTSDGLYWLSVRAYDPTLGRFLSRDPLGRAPLFVGGGNLYVYAGNNPLSNVDPSGQYRAASAGSMQRESSSRTNRMMARIAKKRGCDKACQAQRQQEALVARLARARAIARAARDFFADQVNFSGPTNPAAPSEDIIQEFSIFTSSTSAR